VDDCFKTAAGYLVNPGEIVEAFTGHPGVRDIVVLPVRSTHGTVVGVVVEGEGIGRAELRDTAHRTLPTWLQPQIVVVADRLPRLPGGKADRQGCLELLEQARSTTSDDGDARSDQKGSGPESPALGSSPRAAT